MLTISVLNYHGWGDTVRCIRDLAGICVGSDYRVIVRDNSEISEIDRIKDCLRDLSIPLFCFQSSDNPGFARGHNLNFRAVAHHDGDVFLILNPDISFPDKRVLSQMLGQCYGTRIVSCIIESSLGKIWFSGGFLSKITGMPVTDRQCFTQPVRTVDFVTGCSLMIPCSLFARLGGFDESYFMYSEDVDLCLRARQSSARVVVVKQRIIHRVGSGEKGSYSDLYLYEGTKNRLRCLRRHDPGIFGAGIVLTLLEYGIVRTIQLAVHSRYPWRQIRAAWRGIFDGFVIP